ncbi:hypothetical protein [Oxalobacter paraformigenes]|uniref:Uncharacterized protein n=1 Tax=Oxalobacter paraformigenes TaxID=556268 RepID=T5LQR7_9BURK|nr:hypothetical protein [Oxalobacter paraformigenes]EQM95285.1 hypothetical protein OFAG_02157 [Oxalobacter paraformigenes]
MNGSARNKKYRPVPVWMRHAPVPQEKPETALHRPRSRYTKPSIVLSGACRNETFARMSSLSLCRNLVALAKKKPEKT